mmetsp:Transcript_71638/g.191121  ORF Transcript_71638/g.191121 Transcript_71638/m.191121 type:complete len:210 (+) Transcript_71638:2784-3413(+)
MLQTRMKNIVLDGLAGVEPRNPTPDPLPQDIFRLNIVRHVGEGQEDQIIGRIHGVRGASHATPAVLALILPLVSLVMRNTDRTNWHEAHARCIPQEDVASTSCCRQMVGQQQSTGLSLHNSDPVQLALVHEHEQEPGVVVQRAHHPALDFLHGSSAGQDSRIPRRDPVAALGVVHQDELLVLGVGPSLVHGGQPVHLRLGHAESGVLHA